MVSRATAPSCVCVCQSAQEQCAAEIAWLAARLDALRQQQQTEQQSATQQTRRAYQLLALIGQQERRHRQLATAAQQRGEALRCQLQSQLEALVQEYDADGAAAERYGGRLMKLSWPEAATADSRDPVTMASAGGGAGGSGGVKEPTLTATATPPTVPKVNRSATTASQPWPDQAAAGASGGSGGRVAGGAQGTVSLTHKPSNAVAAAALHRRRQLDSAHHATRSCLKRLGQQREQLLRRMETVTAAVLANLNGQMQDLQLAERIQCGVAALRATLRALCLQAVAELRRTHQAIVQLQQQGQQQQQQQQGEQQQQQQQQGEQQQQQQQQRGEQGKQQEEEGTRQVEAVFDEVNRVAALIRHCSDYLCNDGGAPLQLSEATVGHISSVCQPAEQQPQSRAAAGSSSLSTVVDNTASGGGGGELSRLATPSAQPAGRSSTVSRCVSRELRDAPPLDSYLQLTRKSDASAKLCETSAAAAAGINEARLPAWCDLCAAFQRTSTAIAADRDTDSRNWPLPLAASRRKFDRDDTLAEALKPLGSPDDPADEGNTICLVKQTAEGNASSVVVTANTAAGRPATKAPAAAAAAKSTHNQNRRRRNNNNSNNNSEPAAAATITATTSQYRGLHRLSNQQLLSKLFPGESERGVSEADETGAAATTAAAAAAVVVVADTFMSSVRRHIGASLLQLKDIAAEYYCKQKRKAPTRTDILPVSLHHLLEVVLLRLRSLYHHCRHFDLAAVQLLSSCYDDYLQTVAAVPHELVGGSAGRCTDRLVAISVDTAGRLHRLQTVWHKQVTALHQQLRPALPLARLRQLHQLAADSCDQLQRQLHQLRQMYTKRLAATALAYSTVSDRLAQRYSASSRCITVGWPSEQLASEQLQQQLLAQLTRCVDSALHYSGTQWQQHRQLVDHQFEQHYRRIDQRRVQSLAAWTRDLGKIHKLFSTEPSTNIAG